MRESAHKLPLALLLSLLWCTPVMGQQLEPAETTPQAAATETAPPETETGVLTEEEQARAARRAELTAELEVRLRAIEDLQFNQGIYHPALIEAYSDLANVFEELEEHDQAIRYLTDALQIARINTGLFSEQQLPLIDELITTNARKKDWSEVDDLVHLDYHIASRVYDLDDTEYLAAAEDYGEWKLRVLRENLLQQTSSGLMNTAEELSEFYERLIVSVEFDENVRSEDLLQLLYGKSQADLSIARAVARTPYSYFQGTESRYITRTRCENVRNAAGQIVRQCYPVQVENPRYRQSQIDAKRFAVNRYSSEVNKVIERMALVRDNSPTLSASDRQALDSQIASLLEESEAVRRQGYRSFGF